MRVVQLAPVANQSFVVTLDGIRWVLRLAMGSGAMSVDLTRNGVVLLTGVRAVAGEPIIPYAYLQSGNFIFVTADGELPDYRRFNVSQSLAYLSADEIDALESISYGDVAALAVPEYLTTDDGFYLTTDDGEILTDD